jgi:hypothetical protein
MCLILIRTKNNDLSHITRRQYFDGIQYSVQENKGNFRSPEGIYLFISISTNV